MKKVFIVALVVIAGLLGLHVSISAHKAETTAAKEATFCTNTRIYAEWKVDEASRRRARALAYIYSGEENAPEIAEANARLEESRAAWKAYYDGKSSYKEAYNASSRATWKAGKALVAWSNRTGRCPVNFGEGVIYCYLSFEEDGVTEREESIRLESGEEIAKHESRVRDLFKF